MDDLKSVQGLSSQCYTVENWSLAYYEIIYPVPPTSEWDIPEESEFVNVLPPTLIKTHGRKKNKEDSFGWRNKMEE